MLNFFKLVWHLAAMHFVRLRYFYASVIALVALVGGLFWFVLFAAPWSFPTGRIIIITPGESIGAAARDLADEHAIVSPLLFRAFVRVFGGATGVESGVYTFSTASNVITVAWNITHGVSGIPSIRLTFPEGTTTHQMGGELAASIPDFSESKFDALAAPLEGYLFPDTYFFLPATTEESAVDLMHDNYETHIAKYQTQILVSGHSEQDIVTMASLLEGEGKTLADRRIIAGILWNRLEKKLPLDVDATFSYIYGIPGYAPTPLDLKLASPYNTYLHKGLPPTPINNPGDVSLTAALTPTVTDYLYYLTGTDGQMYYAKTLAEQDANEKKYLK